MVLTTTIVFISCLDLDGFTITHKNKCHSFWCDDILHEIDPLFNGQYVLEIDKSILDSNTKGSRLDN